MCKIVKKTDSTKHILFRAEGKFFLCLKFQNLMEMITISFCIIITWRQFAKRHYDNYFSVFYIIRLLEPFFLISAERKQDMELPYPYTSECSFMLCNFLFTLCTLLIDTPTISAFVLCSNNIDN